MKKLCLFLTVMLGLLIATCATMTSVSAQHDFDAFLGNTIDDTAIDGAIGSEWDDAGNYTSVAISPQGTAEVWTKHDGTYLYMAVRFTADSDNTCARAPSFFSIVKTQYEVIFSAKVSASRQVFHCGMLKIN